MGAHHNPVQRAVVLRIAVVSTGLNGAFDALICIVIHGSFLLFIEYGISMAKRIRIKHGKVFLNIAFYEPA